jgi:type I restriction enzyme M protein
VSGTSVSAAVFKRLTNAKKWERDYGLWQLSVRLAGNLGKKRFDDHNDFAAKVETSLKSYGVKLGAADRKALLRGVSWVDEEAPAVIKKAHKPGKVTADPMCGKFEIEAGDTSTVLEYEPDPDLADFEQVPLTEGDGVKAFVRREVLPYAPDAWIDETSEKIGYEISFTKVFYKPAELRPLEEIGADIRRLLDESEGLVLAAVGNQQ